MHTEPQSQHLWLHKLIGEWTMEGECNMGPDQPVMKHSGVEVVRSLGGLWTIGEGEGEMPEGGTARSIMTLGFDVASGRFVGNFVASMMTHMWVYNGQLDADEKVLTLETEGPNFTGEGYVKYHDIITMIDDDTRTLTSRTVAEDGSFHEFMKAVYCRKK